MFLCMFSNQRPCACSKNSSLGHPMCHRGITKMDASSYILLTNHIVEQLSAFIELDLEF